MTADELYVSRHSDAFGIFVLGKLGVDIDAADYYKTHDDGSHVVSPLFYKYLNETEKDATEPFEDFFEKFTESYI
jgi:hypothetical protein